MSSRNINTNDMVDKYGRADDEKPARPDGYDAEVPGFHDPQSQQHDHGHDDDHHSGSHVDIYDPNRPKLGFKQRLHHFTWAWYTLPMSTGGLALLIFAQPHQFPGLRSIGLAVYIINILIFTAVTALMAARFLLHPGDMSASIKHPREGFFVPTFFLAVATLITSTRSPGRA